ncbi:MAG TPA: hypothetical protein VK348_08855, partial [Planctomycetota bacterium]|nr:hypothetical protein [Planctomycetota bacterium]
MLFRALLMLAAATTTVTAQSPPPTAEPKVLLLDLGDEERALPAVHSLCDLGEGAVPLLLAHVRERLPFGNDDRACLMAIFALARLGDQASAAARPLLEHAATASGMVERQLLWALGELGPQAAVADAE